ncbi:MAG: hypothetical protein ACI8Y3_000860 [Paraglaciecola sp.]
MLFESLDFIGCLAALATEFHVNLTRFHGMFEVSSTVFEGPVLALYRLSGLIIFRLTVWGI